MNPVFKSLSCQEEWDVLTSHVPMIRTEDTNALIAYDGTKMVGAVVMDNWLYNSVQVSIIIANPIVLRHKLLEKCFSYIYTTRLREYIYVSVAETNEKSMKLAKHLGFTEKTRLVGAFKKGVDYVIMELKKEDCNYIPTEGLANV